MAWARVDDGFDDHPKVLALLDEDDAAAGAIAVALWTLCLTWAHRNTRRRGQRHGLLPAALPRRKLGPMGKDAAQLLVKHGLWEPQDDGGWLIHDFDEYLPTESTRDARSEAGKRGAEKRWAEKHAREAEEAAAQAAMANSHTQDGNLPSACHDVASNAVANDGSRAPARREPTPIPKPKDLLAGETAGHETAQTILGAFIDYCASKEIKLPSRHKGHYAKVIDQALQDGFDGKLIRRALASLVETGDTGTPSMLPARIVDIQNGPKTWLPRAPAAAPPPSNAPPKLAGDEQCPKHPGKPRDRCGLCRAERVGKTN